MASTNKNSITPLPVKFEIHQGLNVHDVSGCIQNWEELEITLKREGTSGVFHEISFPFEFVAEAYDIVRNIFNIYQYRAVVDMYIYIRRDDWAYSAEKYHAPRVYTLDFSTYEQSDTVIEVETKRTNLYDILKAKGKITHDIPVSEIKESAHWAFDRINLENSVEFLCTTSGDKTISWLGGLGVYGTIGVSYEKTEIAIQDVIYLKTIPAMKAYRSDIEGTLDDLKFLWLADFADGRWIELNLNITGRVTQVSNVSNFRLLIAKNLNDPVHSYAHMDVNLSSGVIDWSVNNLNIALNEAGQGLYLMMHITPIDIVKIAKLNVELDGKMVVRYNAKGRQENINILDPRTLLQSLVNKMTGSESYKTGIEQFNIDNQNLIMMAAAESIRNIRDDDGVDDAVVHTSYNAFMEFMQAFGYEQHVDEESVIFKKRAASFRRDITAIELTEEDCADLKVTVDEDYLYSGVKVGYKRKELENANGRIEFNGLHDYSTDLTIVDNILELISPYRADCIGIEYLVQERGKDKTDNKSDKDIFLVNLRRSEQGVYVVVRSSFAGKTISNIGEPTNNTMFNGRLNPFAMLLANLDLVGVSASIMKFTASDSNSEIIIDNQAINGSFLVNGGLFDPIVYDIASKNILHLPEGDSINGVVKFRYLDKSKGEIVEMEGFIDEISKNPAWEGETTWKLRKKK
jgi:hypothetical protein